MQNFTVSISVVCRKEKVNQQNEAPLFIRLAYDSKRKFISLREKINLDYWDFENNLILPNYEKKEYLDLLIKEKKQEIDRKILSYKLSDQSISLDEFIEPKTKKQKTVSVVKLFETYIQELFKQERIKNAKYYRCCLNCLLRYTKGKDIEFTQIDASFLTDYANWMQKEKLHNNTIGNRLRGLKAIYNQAILYKYVSKDLSPFDAFKVSKYRMETTKRAITKSDIQKIIKLDLSKISTNINYQYFDFARDIFLFSYFSCGINIVDIAYLKSENIVDNDRLCFYRRKTKKLFAFKMHSEALNILSKYTGFNTSDYIFPILDTQISEIDKYNKVNGALKTINKYLKKIGKHLKIETSLTTYVARHSYATFIKTLYNRLFFCGLERHEVLMGNG